MNLRADRALRSFPLKDAWSANADCRDCTLRQSALFAGLKQTDLEQVHEFVDQFNLPPVRAVPHQ